jgi:transposase
VLLSQDEARVQMVPTLATTLGVKGHRPVVGTRDDKDVLFVFAVVNVTSGVLHTNTLASVRAENRRTGESKNRRMQRAFAAHLRHVGKAYPANRHRRVVLIIDNAPWHRGKAIDAALAANPHLGLYRLPSYSPCLNVVERFWKKLRRRATHNRLFDTIADLKRSVRNSLRYFQTVRAKVQSLVRGCYPAPADRTPSPGT